MVEQQPAKARRKSAQALPYLGFGWAGWAALLVLLLLISERVLDFDWIDLVFRFVAFIFGENAVDPAHRIQIALLYGTETVPMGFMGALLILAALVWSPIRGTSRVYAIVAMLAIGAADLALFMLRWKVAWIPHPTFSFTQIGELMVIPELLIPHGTLAVIACLVVGFATRSWRVGSSMLGVTLAITLLSTWVRFAGHFAARSFDPYLIHWAFVLNLMLIIPVMAWGVCEHHRLRHARCCSACNYDLTGLDQHARCPECGTEIQPRTSPVVKGPAKAT